MQRYQSTVAQMVEWGTQDQNVPGSIPTRFNEILFLNITSIDVTERSLNENGMLDFVEDNIITVVMLVIVIVNHGSKAP